MLVRFCQDKGIHVSGYAPLGRPGKTKDESCMHDPVVKSLAAELSASSPTRAASTYSPASVLLAFSVLRGLSVLPKSSTPERIAHNLHSTVALLQQLEASPLERARLEEQTRKLDRGVRYCNSHLAGEEEGAFERLGSTLFE